MSEIQLRLQFSDTYLGCDFTRQKDPLACFAARASRGRRKTTINRSDGTISQQKRLEQIVCDLAGKKICVPLSLGTRASRNTQKNYS